MPDENFPKNISQPLSFPFQIEKFGVYALEVIARCEAGDLRVEIDGAKLREIPPKDKPQYNNIPSSWNGAELKGLTKTIFFITPLNKGAHTLKFVPTEEVEINSFKVATIDDLQKITWELNTQAEDGDRRPWYAFIFINLPLQSISADASVSWHFFDGDDVKLIIDGQIEKNTQSRFWKDWVWHATPLDLFSGPKRESKTFTKNLQLGTHYVEFWADKSPTLHQISFDLGDFKPERIPSKEDPKWTGDFNDDMDVVLLARLILGEMEGQPEEAKIGAGFTVINRFKKKKLNWGLSLKEVILKESQYDAFVNENTLGKVQDPLNHVAKEEWKNCYHIADQILLGTYSDPTSGATHFYSTSADTGFPWWATQNVFKIKIGITYFYELES